MKSLLFEIPRVIQFSSENTTYVMGQTKHSNNFHKSQTQ